MLRRLMIGSWLALLLGTPVEAQEDYGRTGFYLGIAGSTGLYTKLDGQLGYAREQCLPALEDTDADGEFDVLNPCPPEIDENVGIDADASLGVHARAGYRFLPRLAAEAHLEYLAGSEILVGFGWMKTYGEDRRINPQVEFGQDQGNPTNPNTKIPMAEEIDTDDSGFVGRFGGGIDIYVTRNISIGAGASYVLPFGSWDTAYDYNYVSLDWGLQYRF
jgi:hypothetical protein